MNKTQFAIQEQQEFRVAERTTTSAERWSISNEHIEQFELSGLSVFHDLLIKQDKSEYEDMVLYVLTIYSKAPIARELPDKLLFIFTCLETMLLKDQSEPLQQNVAERMALFIETTVQGRRDVIKQYKDAYVLRSQYIHHGQRPSAKDIRALQPFFMSVWRFLLLACGNHQRFKNKLEFIEHIEVKKLS